jgi:hypothetical protein
MSYRCSFRDIQRSKRPNAINFLFQILLFYFEELKKNQQQHNRTYSERPPYRYSVGSFWPLYISERTTVRHYARSVGTLPNKGNNNRTVLQGAFKTESLTGTPIWLLDFPDLSRLIPMLLFSCSVDWKLRWLSFLSVLSVFVDFPFWMRLGV